MIKSDKKSPIYLLITLIRHNDTPFPYTWYNAMKREGNVTL